MTVRAKAKYDSSLKDANVRRWYDNVARGPSFTAGVYLRRLGSFCQHFNTTPSALASMSEGDLYNLLLDYVSLMEGKEYASSYIESRSKL